MTTPNTFLVLMTGHPSQVDLSKCIYIDTVLFGNGEFVVHVFEIVDKGCVIE